MDSGQGQAKVPIWKPGYPAPHDPLIRQKTPENEEREEQIRRRPGHESVELWRSRPVFLRLARERGQRGGWRRRFLHPKRNRVWVRREEGVSRALGSFGLPKLQIPKMINSPASHLPFSIPFLPLPNQPTAPGHGYGHHPEPETSPTENRFRQLKIPLSTPNSTPVCANSRETE